jgi:ribosomal protein S18 acetylase RimI-like enzyme
MPEIEIRPATAADIPTLIQLDHTSLTTHVWQMERLHEDNSLQTTFREVRLPRPIRLNYTKPISQLAATWQMMTLVLVALHKDQMVGYITLTDQHLPHCLWISDLVVADNLRRKGIGSAMVIASQDWAVRRQLKRVIMEMHSKNYPAIQFAQKLGYEFSGYNDHYYANQDIGLFFGKFLK